VFKERATPHFTPDPRITMHTLVDRTEPWGLTSAITAFPDRMRLRMNSKVYPSGDTRATEFSRLTDKRVRQFLGDCDSDVIVGTRPGLNVYVAQFSPRQAAKVGQEHLFYKHHKPQLRQAMSDSFHRLDALVTVSEADANNYRHHMPHLASKVRFIPNSIQPTALPPSNVDSKVIVAAGRLQRSKRFDMLLKVFAKVHKRHPDWSLRIYGGGKRLDELREVITELDLGDSVSLMGRTTPLDAEWVKGSIAAMTSKYESFGLTLVEAMNCGLPVVSTACDYGPPEIIDHEVDGLLTPVKDKGAVADALCQLIEDEPMRQRMSSAAIEKARQYYPEDIGARYDELFGSLVSHKDRTPPRGARIPVGVASGGSGLSLPVSRRAPRDATVNSFSTSFEDVTLTAAEGFTGRCTLSAGEHADVEIPHDGKHIHLDPAFLRRLPEARWHLFRDGEPVEAGRIDSRALLHRPTSLPGSVVVPYTAARNQFALRVWRRETYAELNSVRWLGGTLLLDGEVLGPRWDSTEVSVVGRLRDNESTSYRWKAKIDTDGVFSVSIKVDDLTGTRVDRKDLWDLWLADDADEHAPVRLGRFFDDMVKRKKTQVFAKKTVDSDGWHGIQPYYNTHNELSIKVKEEG
ncbi:MAG: glycosyltransferase, partial [Stackebrandtia sp.]